MRRKCVIPYAISIGQRRAELPALRLLGITFIGVENQHWSKT